MPFVPCGKHIKSSSQEKASLLAAVVLTRCQQEPEDKTMEEKFGKKKRKEYNIVNKSSYADNNGSSYEEAGRTM